MLIGFCVFQCKKNVLFKDLTKKIHFNINLTFYYCKTVIKSVLFFRYRPSKSRDIRCWRVFFRKKYCPYYLFCCKIINKLTGWFLCFLGVEFIGFLPFFDAKPNLKFLQCFSHHLYLYDGCLLIGNPVCAKHLSSQLFFVSLWFCKKALLH